MTLTFNKGGIHPPENKLTANAPIQALPLPQKVAVLLQQHLGAPATPIAGKGDLVLTGQLIGKAEGFVSANVHAPVSGIVTGIEEILDASGYKKRALVIETKGDDWMPEIERIENPEVESMPEPRAIIQKIMESGITGMGGASFPTHVKLTLPRNKRADCIVINGAECEPYLTADHRLMLEKPGKIILGVLLLMKALQVNRAIIGVENNKPDAIDILRKNAAGKAGIEVMACQVKYPQGGEKQLIKALLNREVPSGGLPVDVGVVVFNVGTTLAVYEAVVLNKPLVERVVTVSGPNLVNPGNFLVRLGTPISVLLNAAGGIPEGTGKLINGGPMMGKALSSTEVPVTKGTSGIVVLPAHQSIRLKMQPCIRCSRCVQACPMGLEPYLLMVLSMQEAYERLEENRVMDCMECGSCSFVCPAHRTLVDYIRLGKSRVSKIIRTRKTA